MNSKKAVFIEIGLLGILLGAAMIGAISYLNRALQEENVLTARRLERAFAPLIRKSHRLHDDLALQEDTSALSQAPGVSFAAFIDPDNKVIAHSQASQIGKSFRRLNNGDLTLNYSFKDNLSTWGTLVFSLSTRSTDFLWMKGVTAGLIFVVGLIMIYTIRLQEHVRAQGKLRIKLADMRTLLEESRLLAAEKQKYMEAMENNYRAYLSASLDRLPDSVILLDEQQRIVMVNNSALDALTMKRDALSVGQSWQDFPLLQNQGTAIERSLESLGQTLPLEIEGGESAGAIRSEVRDGVGVTWVMPRPVLRACR